MKTSDPAPWTVLESKYLEKKDWLTVRQDRVQLPSGAVIDEYFVLEYPEWINVVAVTADEKIVMVRQFRHAVRAVHYELPGGVRDKEDASAEIAARRELLEETGFGGGVWEPLMSVSANPSTHNNLTHSFLARGVKRLQDPKQDQTEDLHVHLLPVPEVRRMVLDGGVLQALHVAPLLKYFLLNP